ncbi:uncharacterized protein ZK1073.1-like [Ptychodera flava]|uniref:uncharacterized protein ZK1073.1-like n=1 Tax=Ptychodera flava TaxID=63121 RepID=UPI00396AB05A
MAKPDLERIVVKTDRHGPFECYIQGDKKARHLCITWHDIGLNYTAFTKFLSHPDMAHIVTKMCFVHINAPGQEPDAGSLPDDHQYASIDHLAEEVDPVLNALGFSEDTGIVGLGEGAGASILLRYTIHNPRRVLGLCLLECNANPSSFLEWSQEKVAAWQLTTRGMNPTTEKFLLWHHFGSETKDKKDLVHEFHENLYKRMNAHNLSKYIQVYMNRSDVSHKVKDIKTPILLVTGTVSPHVKEVEKLFYSLPDKRNTTLLKAEDVGGSIMDENPRKLAESFLLFLQGMGLVASVPMTRLARSSSVGEGSPGSPPKGDLSKNRSASMDQP